MLPTLEMSFVFLCRDLPHIEMDILLAYMEGPSYRRAFS